MATNSMTTNAEDRCAKCGEELAANAPRGLCPACLLQGALESQTASIGDSQPVGESDFTPPAPEQLACSFPDLEILEFIGRGGMGMVYKARQKRLDRLVALKVLLPSISRDAAFAERFAREARAMAMLSHPHIVTVYDFGQTEPAPAARDNQDAKNVPANAPLFYFLMELVDGMNLRRLLDAGKLAPQTALAIVPQICEALQYAHDKGVVHRDIKPENILVDRGGQVKIADFGLAKLVGIDAKDFTITLAGQVMGTPYYMAPEQSERPRDVDHRADIYSLGVVFYQMLTGELPLGRFAAPSKKVVIDVRLDEVVLRALEKEPTLRYQQASEVKTDIHSITSTTPAVHGSVATHAQAWTSPTTGWGHFVGYINGVTFSSRWAYELARFSALGFLSGLAFLSFLPVPGAHRFLGFSGLAGFFGLIGLAFVVEFAARRRAKLAAGSFTSSASSLAMKLLPIFACVLLGFACLIPLLVGAAILIPVLVSRQPPNNAAEALPSASPAAEGVDGGPVKPPPIVNAPSDMQAYLNETQELVRERRYPEALKRFLWFDEHALEHDAGMSGVRLSFALSYWRDLGEVYPPAKQALVDMRDRKVRELREGRGNSDLFQDVASENDYLDQKDQTSLLFREIDKNNPALAQKSWIYVKDLLFEEKRYSLINKYIPVPLDEYEKIKTQYDLQMAQLPKLTNPESVREFFRKSFVKDCLQLIELAAFNGDRQTADDIRNRAAGVINDPNLQTAGLAPSKVDSPQAKMNPPPGEPAAKLSTEAEMGNYLNETRELIRQRRYREALQRFEWFDEHAVESSQNGRQAAIRYWKVLGDAFPPAMKALEDMRERKSQQLREGHGSPRLFADVVTENNALNQNEETVKLLQDLDAANPELAAECFYFAKTPLFKEKRYELIRRYIPSPMKDFELAEAQFNQDLAPYRDAPRSEGDGRQAIYAAFVNDCLQLIELATATGEQQAADEICNRAIALTNDPRLNRLARRWRPKNPAQNANVGFGEQTNDITPVAQKPVAELTLVNASMEEGSDSPRGWTHAAGEQERMFFWDKTVGHRSARSLCVLNAGTGYFKSEWTQIVRHPSRTSKLRVSAYVKAENVRMAVLVMRFDVAPGASATGEWAAYIGEDGVGGPPVSHDWTQYAGIVQAPAGVVQYTVVLQSWGPGKIWFDDVKVDFMPDDTPATEAGPGQPPMLAPIEREAKAPARAVPASNSGDPLALVNGAMEQGDDAPMGWQQSAPVSGVEYVWDKTVGHNSARSLALHKTAERYFPIAQWTQFVPNPGTTSKLRVSAWVKAENAKKGILDVQFRDKGGGWSHQWVAYIGEKTADDPPANHDWTEYSGVVEIPPGAEQLGVGLQIYGPGKLWFDDVKAEFVPGETPKTDAVPGQAPNPRTGVVAENPEEKISDAKNRETNLPYPQIIKTIPERGAKGVDPDLKEITVTFDRDMGQGMSWTGGPPLFPPVDENREPRWSDARTCALPVKLAGGSYYRVGINSTSFQNFRSASGVAAPPSALWFCTQGATEEIESRLRSPQVVTLEPANGATDVDPAIIELKATFDMPMGGGMSWTGGKQTIPEPADGREASWSEDRRTCVYPVKLTPGREYELSLNSLAHINFQSEWGVPLAPAVYKFRTRDANRPGQ